MSILTDLFPDLTDLQDDFNEEIVQLRQSQLYDYSFQIDELKFHEENDQFHNLLPAASPLLEESKYVGIHKTDDSSMHQLQPPQSQAWSFQDLQDMQFVSLPNLEIGLMTPPLTFIEETEPSTPVSLGRRDSMFESPRADSTASSTANGLGLVTTMQAPSRYAVSSSPASAEDTQTKRISDSRLSLPELAKILNLQDDHKETAKREREVLKVLKEELGFQLGQKTWIRDTPVAERNLLITQLRDICEERFHYGYSKEILETIVRRASYYMMQGRLRRERRAERKGKKA
ncbi:unnamed protein product [Kuraishia capsulata CBS 1993]|uniref:Uncharacterized protein n=1 Tax=Kuraishia capsulata CBS 1993 TaxID=1382522 RepID=W6MF93_9ASCO|nr:uncharacterized protein KUCA_T00000356001 [Kuraishia capsulata CBS 1993]CDK24394.1 unnamed protein product [Kuraishia capsulata CBS 1993]